MCAYFALGIVVKIPHPELFGRGIVTYSPLERYNKELK
ncbi:hypothetical protein ATE84_0648 [Aquimarina sp. MAR_2010_214]|nr:hypothetical protein ATE84_0648 [Aquimarina sp. MAR_2010_214]